MNIVAGCGDGVVQQVKPMFASHDTTFELSLPSVLGYEKVARHMLAWLGPALGYDDARVADLQTAVCEAMINAIEHGNQCRAESHVRVAFSFCPDHLDALISDDGYERYVPRSSGPATIEDKLAGLAPARGMGLMLAAALVDEAGFLPLESGTGNQFFLRIYRAPQAPHACSSCAS